MIDFKLPKKLIVFFMALILVSGCTAISMDPLPFPSTGTPLARQDTAQDKPLLTWEAVKELTAGSLSYSEIRDSFYFNNIGSGMYVISFPIKDGPDFSLRASSTGPDAEPLSIMLRCESADLSLQLNAENLGIILDLFNNEIPVPQDTEILTVTRFNREPLPTSQDHLVQDEQDEQDVQALVEAFGKKIQAVSISAPPDSAAAGIAEHYSDYVTPELLQQWQADPQRAPGRMVSSPWPDRIDILTTEMYAIDQCTVHGEIIEVTSLEMVQGGAAAKRPVEIALQKVKDRWLISGVSMGEYVQPGPVVYENTRYGFSFHLPETWKGYRIVEEQWRGTRSGETVETGPQLLIRHPKWTPELPHQDIPIMVFTPEQWKALQKEELSVGAAPMGPRKLGGNSRYIFAIPARYNYAFPTGYEEVEDILQGSPLWPSRQSAPLQEKETGIKFD